MSPGFSTNETDTFFCLAIDWLLFSCHQDMEAIRLRLLLDEDSRIIMRRKVYTLLLSQQMTLKPFFACVYIDYCSPDIKI